MALMVTKPIAEIRAGDAGGQILMNVSLSRPRLGGVPAVVDGYFP
jgi:hypothetical protein